jgi:hypothetical protein
MKWGVHNYYTTKLEFYANKVFVEAELQTISIRMFTYYNMTILWINNINPKKVQLIFGPFWLLHIEPFGFSLI